MVEIHVSEAKEIKALLEEMETLVSRLTPEQREQFGFRYPLVDELGGAAIMLMAALHKATP